MTVFGYKAAKNSSLQRLGIAQATKAAPDGSQRHGPSTDAAASPASPSVTSSREATVGCSTQRQRRNGPV